jgi:hypothetical protein
LSSRHEILHQSAAVTLQSVPFHQTPPRQGIHQMFKRKNGLPFFDGPINSTKIEFHQPIAATAGKVVQHK